MQMMTQKNSLPDLIRFRKLVLVIGVAIFILFLTATRAHPKKDIEEKVKSLSMIEKVRVRLLLFDVIVEDREENPISGLSKDDFHLFIDGVEKPISTLEEYCRSTLHQVSDIVAAGEEEDEEIVKGEDLSEDFIDINPRYIIFYFDGAHLSMSGRIRTIDAS